MKLASLFLFLCLGWSLGALSDDFYGNDQGVYDGQGGVSSSGSGSNPISQFFGSLFGGSANDLANDGVEKCKPMESGVSSQSSGYQYLSTEAQTIQSAVQLCAKNANLAQKACLETLSPNISNAASILGGMASAASQMQSGEQMCKNNGGALDQAKKALTAYNGACGGAKAACDMLTCPKVQTTIEEQKKAALAKCNAIQDFPEYKQHNACIAEYQKFQTYAEAAGQYGSCNKQGCQKYGMQLASAAAGIAQMISQMQASKECEDKLKNQAKQDQPLDCTKPENASNSTCICQKNPRQAGCPGVAAGAGEKASPIGSGAGGKISGLNGVSTMPGIDLSSQPSGSGADSTLGAGGGSGGGYGGGAGGKGLGSAGAAGGAGAGGKYAPSANIYGGDAGGGGAGGKSGGAGYADKYGKYAPTKEQARKLATGSIGEITGKSGKSNWDKIKERYSDNRASLLNK